MKKIGIIGKGYVGTAYVNFFEEHYEVLVYDPAFKDSNTKEEINKCDCALVSVPTPMNKDGSCDTSILEETIKWLKVPQIMIKSTIPPGTTDRLNDLHNTDIVFSPEYIGEGRYFTPYWKYLHPTNAKYHNFVTIGGSKKARLFWIEIFKPVMGPDAHYLQTDAKTAEMAKYGTNVWGATKVVLFNELYSICEAFDIDFEEFRELMLFDNRIERIHTAVFKNKRGYGGKCFPKDVQAIYDASVKAGYTPDLVGEVIKSNERFNKLNEL